jgi:HAD superfamily hydrolase (TIGR01549 family)
LIKGIFFDVHGTLIDKGGMEGIEKGHTNIAAFLNSHGFPVTKELYREVWLSNLKKHRRDFEELNEVSFYGWYRGILEDLGISKTDENWIDQINKEWMKGFANTTIEIPPAKEILSKLRPLYRLGIISNSLGRNTELDLIRTKLREFFDVLIVSSEIGKRKPHPKIFEAGLEALGLKPEEAVMVGDNFEEDIIGAKKVGMKTVYLVQEDSLKSLSRLGKAHPASADNPRHVENKNEVLKFSDGVLETLEGLESLISNW